MILIDWQSLLMASSFSQEATDKYNYGTVHGAYISGYRAAEEILKLEDFEVVKNSHGQINDSGLVDSPLEQIKHGMKNWDVICRNGFVLKDETSTEAEDVECVHEKKVIVSH